MLGFNNSANDKAYDAIVKEATFLRDEILQCIQHVRYLTIRATYIAGITLPVLAALVSADLSKEASAISEVLTKDTVYKIVQFICIGVSFTCLAFLRIYIGSFKQIFMIAKYFRKHIIPTIKIVGTPPDGIELFHWENWLKTQRANKANAHGDIDLSVEPMLIGIYALLYCLCFIAIGIWKQSWIILSIILGLIIIFITVATYFQFTKILQEATIDEEKDAAALDKSTSQ